MVKVQKRKSISVVLALSVFGDLKSRIGTELSEEDRQNIVDDYLRGHYGVSNGSLSVVVKAHQVKLTWQHPDIDSVAEASHHEALVLAKSKNYENAITLWVKAIVANPNDPDYYFNLGIVFFEQKNYKESIENLTKALTLCPIYYKAQLILGTAFLKIRKFDQAEVHLKESTIYYPEHPLALLNLGAVYSIQKKYSDAIGMFSRTIELSPEEVRAHFGAAKVHALLNETEVAVKYYQRVVDLNKNPQLTMHAKRAMATMTSTASAVPVMPKKLGKVSPKQVEEYYQEGYRSYLYGDYNRATQMHNQYLQYKSKDDFVWFSLGEACIRAGSIEDAVTAFRNAIKENPGKGLYLKELGIAYNYLHMNGEAVDCFKKAEKLGKDDSITNTIWGKILVEQGRYEEAKNKLERALQMNSNNMLAKYNLAIANLKSNQIDSASDALHEIVKTPLKSPIKLEAESLINRILQA